MDQQTNTLNTMNVTINEKHPSFHEAFIGRKIPLSKQTVKSSYKQFKAKGSNVIILVRLFLSNQEKFSGVVMFKLEKTRKPGRDGQKS